MTEIAKAYYEFFSHFNIPAYEENTVPDDVQLPYITYQIVVPEWRDSASVSASVWYEGTDMTGLFAKVDEISDFIGDGTLFPNPHEKSMFSKSKDGDSKPMLYINKETPFSQTAPTTNDNVKVVYLNLGIQVLS